LTGDINVTENSGNFSTGANTTNTIYKVQLPDGGLRTPDEVACAARVAELGPHAAGPLFVGRGDELAELEEALVGGAGVITTGLGGVGKSTLAHRFAEVHRDRYNPIWWINAEDPAEIEAGLAGLARRLYPVLTLIPDPEAADWGRAWLSGHTGWLVVLDNATDPAHVADLANAARGGRFVVTSRLTVGWEHLAKAVPLGVLTSQQARDLLALAAGKKELLSGVAELCDALGYLPLAVRLAAAYMRENGVTAATYLSRLTERDGAVLRWTSATGDPKRTIARIWLVSLRGITERHGALALELLRVLAWLAPTDIPVSLLYRLPNRSAGEIDEALGRLAAYALITREDDAVAVHRMVQAAARHAATAEPAETQAIETARESAVTVLLDAIPDFRDPAGWPTWRRLMPHIDALTAHSGPGIDDHATLALVGHEASYLKEQGQTTRAIQLFEQTLAHHERILGPNHPNTLISRDNLASAYRAAGDLGRAIPLHEQTLAESERILGPDHSDTLISRNNLASAYRAAGDLDRAIPLYEQALTESERVLGPNHSDTLISRNNLADAYRAAGDLGRAIPLHEQTLTDRERILGPNHPSTLISRNNLANAYYAAGDLGRAIPLHEQTLTDRERILGPNHPDTLTSQNNLASAYRAAGDLGRAIPLHEQTLAESERVLGPNHPNTLTSRNNLAYSYRTAGDLDRAIPLYEQNLADRERILGPNHPDTLTSQNNLAYAYHTAGDLGRAIPLHEQTLADRERILGPNHPDTLTSRNNLAEAYRAARDPGQAEPS
jgi:tetratricopeptide (TPR) repeat protein